MYIQGYNLNIVALCLAVLHSENWDITFAVYNFVPQS
jgi:hypothetical protein